MMRILRGRPAAHWLLFLLYFLTFAPAAVEKWAGGEVPAWFLQQFEKTWLGLVPVMIPPSFWGIAACETVLSLLFAALLIRPALAPRLARPTLLGALALLVALATGQRLAHQFDQALLLLLAALATFFVRETIAEDGSSTF